MKCIVEERQLVDFIVMFYYSSVGTVGNQTALIVQLWYFKTIMILF